MFIFRSFSQIKESDARNKTDCPILIFLIPVNIQWGSSIAFEDNFRPVIGGYVCYFRNGKLIKYNNYSRSRDELLHLYTCNCPTVPCIYLSPVVRGDKSSKNTSVQQSPYIETVTGAQFFWTMIALYSTPATAYLNSKVIF